MPKTILKDQRSTTSFNFQFDLYNYFSYTITLQENIFIRIAQKYVILGRKMIFKKKGGGKKNYYTRKYTNVPDLVGYLADLLCWLN